MYNILIVDDHSAICIGMTLLVQNVFPSAQIHTARNTPAAVERMKNDKYDLLLLDINMPDSDPVSLMEWIGTFAPATKVLVFSMNAEEVYGKRFLQLGAKGYLKKSAPEHEINRALNLVMSGKKYISNELAEILSDEIINGKSSNPFDDLSGREFEIAMCLIKGDSLSDICNLLHIQYSTVSSHKQRLFEKLKVTNVLQLLELAKSYGLATV